MQENYRDIGSLEDRVIEELSELIQAICKAKRFGIQNYHPKTKKSNIQSILDEMGDVTETMNRYEEYLIQTFSKFPSLKIAPPVAPKPLENMRIEEGKL